MQGDDDALSIAITTTTPPLTFARSPGAYANGRLLQMEKGKEKEEELERGGSFSPRREKRRGGSQRPP